MGLYQKICEHFINPQNSSTEKSMGLLAKAQEFLASNPIPHFSVNIDAPFVFFKNFAYEVGLQKVAVLIPVENQYQTIFSYGIESASREENISTLDFWNGTISTEAWYSLSGEDLSSFYQLFSENDIHNLKHIHIKKFLIDENNYAIILILQDTENSLIDVETHIDESYVSDESVRIEIHQLINSIKDYESLTKIKSEIEDRFGRISEKLSIGAPAFV